MSLSRLFRILPARHFFNDFLVPPRSSLASIMSPRMKDMLVSATSKTQNHQPDAVTGNMSLNKNHHGDFWNSMLLGGRGKEGRSGGGGLQVKEDDKTYSVLIDLPEGIKASDISLKLEEDGNTIHLSGLHKTTSEDGNMVTQSKFVRRFTMGNHYSSLDHHNKNDTIELDKLTATLSDQGLLTLTAPKKVPQVVDNATSSMKEIHITEVGGEEAAAAKGKEPLISSSGTPNASGTDTAEKAAA